MAYKVTATQSCSFSKAG